MATNLEASDAEDLMASRVREARDRCGYSQAAFALAVGTSRRTVIRWEQGRTTPPASCLQKIAALAGVTVDWLCGVEEPSRVVREAKQGAAPAIPRPNGASATPRHEGV